MHVNITDFLDLELLDVVSHYVWVLEIEPEPSAREESALNSRPFLKLCNLFFFNGFLFYVTWGYT